MLVRLRLQNFRGFDDHELSFERLTLIVGRNNAGKSTIIEALRLVALATARARTLTYLETPRELRYVQEEMGFSPSMRDIEFNTQNLFFRYGRAPALIEATFDSNDVLRLYINDDGAIFCTIKNAQGFLIGSRQQARRLALTNINILPQVAPLALTERHLTPEYIRRAASSVLASSHFRNQLLIFNERFEHFRSTAEQNWPRLRIRDFITDAGEHMNELQLFIQDDGFVAEVAWMGHGLQIWLQTMWFVSRIEANETIILDEPDVYLHADLQRRLIRLLKREERQSIIATHSVEMISEVDPGSVLVVDRRRARSSFAPTLPAVQKAIDAFGGVHNIHLARMWSSRKLLLTEGKEMGILKRFQDLIFPDSTDPIDAVPHMRIGGWGGWNYAIGSVMLLKNAGGEDIVPFCILDSDFHLEDDVEARLEEAKRVGVELHVWSRKEIENYIINPEVIHRLLAHRVRGDRKVPSPRDIKQKIEAICDEMKDEVVDNFLEEYIRRKRPKETAEGNRYARSRVNRDWSSFDAKLNRVGGKELLARISTWLQQQLGISISAAALLAETSKEDLPEEVVKVMTAIERGTRFDA